MLAKAVAHHTTAAFIRVVGSEFVQKYLGEVRARMEPVLAAVPLLVGLWSSFSGGYWLCSIRGFVSLACRAFCQVLLHTASLMFNNRSLRMDQ